MPWTPLLDGSLAIGARDAVRDIAVAVARAPAAASAADRALFWAYATPALDAPFAQAAYDAALDDLIGELSRGAHRPALCGGLAGLGWTLGHVLEPDADDPLGAIDDVLVDLVGAERWDGPHDLVHGLAGLGVYFLDRIAATGSARAREGLAHVVRHLDASATRTEHGATWRTPPALLSAEDAAAYPDGYYDCGLAHGAPGAIAVLARAAALAAPPPGAAALCAEAVRWLAHQRQPEDPRGRFPIGVGADRAPGRARAAWCYGDPGVAAALWTAAPELARETARAAAARSAATAGVTDAGLCHGAAGLAHLANRFFHATGDGAFADAARAWFERALAMRRAGGIGGVVADRGGTPAPDGSLLEGAIGVGLALLAALGETAPTWDRVLACDLPQGA